MPDLADTTADENSLEFFLKSLWDKRAYGLNISTVDLFQTVTHENVLYLLNLYPFLQMTSSDIPETSDVAPKFITAKNGWIIHDYGFAMSSSLGELLYSANEYHQLFASDDDEGGAGGGDALNPNGTVVNQAFDTAMEMVRLAQQKNWPGINIISGSPVMQWAAWFAAHTYNMQVSGYEPDDKARAKQVRLAADVKRKLLSPEKNFTK